MRPAVGAATAAAAAFAASSLTPLLPLHRSYNYGTDADDSFPGYCNGNADPGRGFGHICVSVPDIESACARFAKLGVPFIKKLGEGSMPDIAFIADPDGYWVEVVQPSLMRAFAADLPPAGE
jgi:lactoylglutathione lyase